MNPWARVFIGTPRRFGIWVIVFFVIACYVNPEFFARIFTKAVNSTLIATQPLLELALTIFIVYAIFKLVFKKGGKK